MTKLLEVRNLTRTFGALNAVAGVSFSVRQGELVGLIGPNGAGKSTLYNLIAGAILAPIGEELFFRGYLMERLEQVWPPTRRLFGAKVGWALIVSSALFALGHVAVIPNPQRLAVFFPALLFGWMRARTGSIAAGATYHALCNILADTLHVSYFG